MLIALFACNDSGVTAFNAEPTAEILSHADGDGVDPGEATTFEGSVSDPDDGPSRLLATWSLDGDEVCEATAPDDAGLTSCEVTITEVEGTVSLLVTDSQNASASDEVDVVTCVPEDAEVCDNGIDDDCDGRIDEDCLGTNCFDDDDTFVSEQAYTLLIGRMDEGEQVEGYFRDDFEFEGTAGAEFAVHMWSTAFDTRVQLFDQDCELYLEASDGARGDNAFLSFQVPTDGIWTIVATGDIPLEGEYVIEFLQDETEVGVNCARETAALDIVSEPWTDTVDGILQSGDQENIAGAGFYNDDVEYLAFYGDTVVSTDESTAHDAAMALFDPDCQLVTYNDDSPEGGTTNARVDHEVERTGIYTLTPFTKYQYQTGLYTVTSTATWAE